jgi:hypothetical protein
MKKVKVSLLFVFFYALIFCAQAQQLISIKDFSIKTPFLEPDNRRLSEKVTDSTFLALSKNKGNSGASSVYLLEMYDKSLGLEWSIRMVIPPNENFLDLKVQGNEAILFSVIYDQKKTTSKLYARLFDIESGSKKDEKVLGINKVGNWVDATNKGAVHKDIFDYIGSGSKPNFVTPLMYRYFLNYSPDGEKILIYFYDHSKTDLWANILIFDQNLKFISEAQLPINKGHINYGLHINNNEDVFLLNSDALGTIELIKYDLKTKVSVFLDIKPSNTGRSDFHLAFKDNDHIYVANLNKRGGELVGVMYSLFNFSTKTVDKVRYYKIPDRFIIQKDSLFALNSYKKNISPWTNYNLVNFELTESGEKVMVLEQRDYFSPGFSYSQEAVNHVNYWYERKGQVAAEDILLFAFDNKDEIKWMNQVFKKQYSLASDGFNSIGFKFNIRSNNNIQLLFTHSEITSSSAKGKIKYVEVDGATGGKVVETDLPVENKLYLIKNYTQWFNDRVVIVGSKGFGGRSSAIATLDLNEDTGF